MKKCIIFLEPKGTILEVIRSANVRGYRVIAFSSDSSLIEGAPEPYQSAVSLIDRIYPIEKWNDEGAIKKLCETIDAETPIAGIYGGMDSCARILAVLREKYGLPTASPEALDTVLDKGKLRNKLRELGLSRIKSFSGNEVDQWTDWKIGTAAYFKPTHGFFSAYVERCEGLDDLKSARSKWRAGNPNDPAYVKKYIGSSRTYELEEEFQGELLSVEAISFRGEFKVIGLLSRILYSKNPVIEMGSCFPYPHPAGEKITALVREAHEKLGLTDGPTHTEVIINVSGEVEIIDLNPRFVGADVLQSINYALGIKMEESLLDYALGEKPNFIPSNSQYSCLQYFLPPEVPVLNSIEFPNDVEVPFHSAFMKLGSKILDSNRQFDYLGCYLTVCESFVQAVKRSKELREKVRINQTYEGVY